MVTFSTEVVSSYGRTDAGRIEIGDKVMSPYGYRRVERIAYGGYQPIREYKIYFDDIPPIKIECTEKQMIWTDLGYAPIGYLKEGMNIMVRGQEDLKRIKFVIYDNGRTEDVYGIKLADKKVYDEETERWIDEDSNFWANNILIKAFV